MKNSGSILALLIVGLIVYLYRGKLAAILPAAAKVGTANTNFAVGSPTPGNVAGGPAQYNVPFAWTADSGDMFGVLPPGYYRNSTGGITAYPDANGIGGGFAT